MFFFHIQAIVSSFELYGFLVRKTLSSSIHLVQRLLPRLLMVRSGEYLVDIQYHHRLATKLKPGSYYYLWHIDGCEYSLMIFVCFTFDAQAL